DVFMDEAFSGDRFLYLTNTRRNRFKVGFVRTQEGIVVLQGAQWKEFALDGIDPKAILGYAGVEGRLSRVLEWVYYPNIQQILKVVGFDLEFEAAYCQRYHAKLA
ncbi:hypothetical protein Tco_1485922, partial [Tanacetum coccineum]